MVAGVTLSFHGIGRIITGFALISIATWLLHFDLIAITIRKKGLTQFIAASLALGYFALLLTGIFFYFSFLSSIGI
jgi:hypothetical protein